LELDGAMRNAWIMRSLIRKRERIAFGLEFILDREDWDTRLRLGF